MKKLFVPILRQSETELESVQNSVERAILGLKLNDEVELMKIWQEISSL